MMNSTNRTVCDDLGYCPYDIGPGMTCAAMCGVGRDNEIEEPDRYYPDPMPATLEHVETIIIKKYIDHTHDDVLVEIGTEQSSELFRTKISMVDSWDAAMELLRELLDVDNI